MTLREYLRRVDRYGAYVGLRVKPGTSPDASDAEGANGEDADNDVGLFRREADKIVTVRFQTVFLPVSAAAPRVQFRTSVYNYNTHSDKDPRNLLLLCTPQGTSVQQDGSGSKAVMPHVVGPDGRVARHWLAAEATRHAVGGAQQETAAEAAEALAAGKATAVAFGTTAMGARMNVQMLIQVPLSRSRCHVTAAARGASAQKTPPLLPFISDTTR